MAWYDSAWGYRKALTIDAAQVDATLTDFPVLVFDQSTDLNDFALASGDDILFTSSDGETKLAHEIEEFVAVKGDRRRINAWVKVPSLSDTVDTVIYMYFGNPDASNQEDVNNVWDSNYKGVWHLAEDPSGTAPQMQDSSGNGNHATCDSGFVAGQSVAAKVGDGLDYTSASDESVSGSLTHVPLPVTISFWAKFDTDAAGNKTIFLHHPSATENEGYSVGHLDGDVRFNLPSVADYSFTTLTPMVAGTWYYIAVTVTENNGDATAYLNGETETLSIGTPAVSVPDSFIIGFTTALHSVNGILDEVRISNIVRSADWYNTEYNNQNAPATFLSIGTLEEAPTGPTPTHTYQHQGKGMMTGFSRSWGG